MGDWNDEEAGEMSACVQLFVIDREKRLPVRVVCNTSQSVIPSQECREQREEAAGFENRCVWRTHGITM